MTTSLHVTTLDGIVHTNSLFTLAVFIGLAMNMRDPNNDLIVNTACQPEPSVAEDLVAFHVYSFASFLFSSLIAMALKQAVRLSKTTSHSSSSSSFRASHPHFDHIAHYINKTMLRVGLLVSGVGSVAGCLFLMLALINVVQVKLGTLSCGSGHTFAAVVPLVILVPLALLIHVCLVIYAFTR